MSDEMKKARRFKKVCLLFPNYDEKDMGALHPPLGIGYLAERLRQKGIDYRVVDSRLSGDEVGLKRVSAFKPDLVGVSMMTLLYKKHYELVRRIKELNPEVKVIAGGPHISTFREKALEECPSMDYGGVLEGEETLVELCEGKNHKDIKGLIYREGPKVVYTGDRMFDCDMDSIPFPTYAGFEMNGYITDEIGILTSRGCPYLCTYCPVEAAIGRKYRMRTAISIVDEIEYWRKIGYRRFDIIDDNFTLVKKRVFEFCDELKRRGMEDIEFKCGNGLRADKLDRGLLARMKEVGFKHISIGVEAGNNKVLKRLKKGEDIAMIKEAIKDACELGFDVTLFFLVGSPGETWKDFEDSISIALSYPVFDARFYNLIPFPKTELFDWLDKNGYLLQEPDRYLNDIAQFDATALFSTPDMTVEERQSALIYARKVRKLVRMRAMERKLKKFKTLGSLIARIYVNDYVQTNLLRSRIIRRSARRIYDYVSAGRDSL